MSKKNTYNTIGFTLQKAGQKFQVYVYEWDTIANAELAKNNCIGFLKKFGISKMLEIATSDTAREEFEHLINTSVATYQKAKNGRWILAEGHGYVDVTLAE